MADVLTLVGTTASVAGQSGIVTYSYAVTGGTIYVQKVLSPQGDVLGVASSFVASSLTLPPVKLTTLNATTGTLAAGVGSGAGMTIIKSTNATPGAQLMRTPAQVLTDTPGLAVGSTYLLRIVNTGAGTLTLTTDSGSGFTIVGTATVAQNVFRDYTVTLDTGSTGTITEVGNGTYS